MAQLFTFNLGVTGKSATTGYQFYDSAGASLGARSVVGVTEFGTTGIYWRSQTLPTGAVCVVWNETTSGVAGIDDFISRLDAAGTRAALGMASADLDIQLDAAATEVAVVKSNTLLR